jgi:phage recombination protein Bet
VNEIVKYSPDQMALIKRTVAQGATDDELNLFIYDCQRRNIHPLDKLLHFTKRGGRYVPITSIDLMRSRASETGQMAGSDDAKFYNEVDNRGRPEFATVTVYRLTFGQRFPYTATARWDEYYPGDGPAGQMWRKMPYVMLSKCAEALALRKGFPQELAGLYAKEEMDQADAPVQRAAPKIGPNVLRHQIDNCAGYTSPNQVIDNPATTPTPETAADHVTVPQQEPDAVPQGDTGGGLSLLDMAREAAKHGNRFFYDAFWDMRSPAERKQMAAIRDELNALMKEADDQATNKQDA